MNEEPNIRPRNDFCLVKAVKVDKVRGLAMPDIATESEQYFVQAIGPKVDKDSLKVGDRCLMTGKPNVDWSKVPGWTDLIIIREGNIVLTFGEEPAADPN